MGWLPKIRAGAVVGLTMPVMKDGKYVWTREEAEAIRDAYVSGSLFDLSVSIARRGNRARVAA